MNKTLPNIIVGVLVGLLIAWLLGLFSSTPAPAAASATVVSSTSANSPTAKPIASTPATVIKNGPTPSVAAPVVPPVQVARNAPAISATQAAAQQNQTPTPSQIKAITNNLRQLAAASQQYMLDHGVASVNYFDLTGDPNGYLRNVTPVMGEDYTGFSAEQSTTEITISTPDGTTVTFTQ